MSVGSKTLLPYLLFFEGIGREHCQKDPSPSQQPLFSLEHHQDFRLDSAPWIYFQFGRYTRLGFPLMPELLGNVLSPMPTQAAGEIACNGFNSFREEIRLKNLFRSREFHLANVLLQIRQCTFQLLQTLPVPCGNNP